MAKPQPYGTLGKLSEFPINPKLVTSIKLKDEPIQFDGDCVDPYAKFIISEALDFAIETALRRLKSAGKAISDVETKGYPSLQLVQGLRDSFEKAPKCPRELTSSEKDMISTYLAREGIKKPKEKTGKAKPEPARPLVLTPEVWNTMPISERSELATKAGMKGKQGSAAGSFKATEWKSLVKAYLGPSKEPPPPVEVPQIKLYVVKAQDPKTRETKQIGFDVLDPKTEKVVRRITTEEGVKLLGEAKAKTVGSRTIPQKVE